jgi:hypothetical protein
MKKKIFLLIATLATYVAHKMASSQFSFLLYRPEEPICLKEKYKDKD